MILKSYKVIDDYVVINDMFYYKLDALHRLYLEDTFLKASKKGWIGEWFSLNGFEGDIEDVIAFIKDTNKRIRNAKSEDYLVIEWGIFGFIMLSLMVCSCFVGMLLVSVLHG